MPVLVARLEERLVQPSRRIGDVDVDASERVLSTPLHLLYRAKFACGAHHHERLRAERLRLTCNAACLGLIGARVNDYVRPARGKLEDDSAANVAARPRHED